MKFRILAALAALFTLSALVGISTASAAPTVSASGCSYWNGCKPFHWWRTHPHHRWPAARTTATTSAGCLFTSGSYWCTPLDASGTAPVDPRSDSWRADTVAHNRKPYLSLTDSLNWSQPIYDATCSDPLHHIVPTSNGPTLDIHIPNGAKPAQGTDSQLTVEDHCTGQDVDLHHASVSGGTWKVEQTSRYYMNTHGLEESVFGGSPGNVGHRGMPTYARAFKLSEVQAAIANGQPDVGHRLEAGWYDTGAGQTHAIWPMAGWEKRHHGGVPEGIVVRIKPGVKPPAGMSAGALVIFHTLQNYGAVIGDTGGTNTVKLQNYVNWGSVGVNSKSLSKVPWSAYEFVRAGYDPSSGATH